MIIIFASKIEGKISIVIVVSKDIASSRGASELAKKISGIVGGSGGGNDELAQEGGSNVNALTTLEQEIIALLENGEEFFVGGGCHAPHLALL